jgi:hypothetical protein
LLPGAGYHRAGAAGAGASVCAAREDAGSLPRVRGDAVVGGQGGALAGLGAAALSAAEGLSCSAPTPASWDATADHAASTSSSCRSYLDA